MTTSLTGWAFAILFIVIVGYFGITENGLFGTEEERVITVVDKESELIYDSGWVRRFWDDEHNEYNTNYEIFNKIQPGHMYHIKTGKQNIITGHWNTYYAEDLGDGGRSYIVTGKQSFLGSQWRAQFTEDPGEGDKP
jgi:hypothetical protein